MSESYSKVRKENEKWQKEGTNTPAEDREEEREIEK